MDLICIKHGDEPNNYVLIGVDLKLWEIDPFDAKNLDEFLAEGKLPERKPLEQPLLLPVDSKTDASTTEVGSSFLYLTREQGLGVITITDVVTEARDITGMFSAPKGVGFHRGVRFDYHSIAR